MIFGYTPYAHSHDAKKIKNFYLKSE